LFATGSFLTNSIATISAIQWLRDVGFDAGKIDFVASEIAAAAIKSPRPVSAGDVRELLIAAY
jgi:hypothetical protein